VRAVPGKGTVLRPAWIAAPGVARHELLANHAFRHVRAHQTARSSAHRVQHRRATRTTRHTRRGVEGRDRHARRDVRAHLL